MKVADKTNQKTPTTIRLIVPFILAMGLWILVAFNSDRSQVPPLEPTSSVVLADEPGETVFNTICATCHSLTPPMKEAPPMLMVVKHYFEKHETSLKVDEALIEWLKEPAVEKSSLPEHAIERFGLMPPLVLPDSSIRAVVDYIMHEYNAQSDSGEMTCGMDMDMEMGSCMNGKGDENCAAMQKKKGEKGKHMMHGEGEGCSAMMKEKPKRKGMPNN